ncbi:MAG: DUF3789 domain-containing protein [Aeriscardovia sp.]|nr:DUF3789 domain-containing protein [Aeriscardovia sp.]
MTFWILIALSFFAGTMTGVLIMCMCAVAKRGDRE